MLAVLVHSHKTDRASTAAASKAAAVPVSTIAIAWAQDMYILIF